MHGSRTNKIWLDLQDWVGVDSEQKATRKTCVIPLHVFIQCHCELWSLHNPAPLLLKLQFYRIMKLSLSAVHAFGLAGLTLVSSSPVPEPQSSPLLNFPSLSAPRAKRATCVNASQHPDWSTPYGAAFNAEDCLMASRMLIEKVENILGVQYDFYSKMMLPSRGGGASGYGLPEGAESGQSHPLFPRHLTRLC